MRATTNLGAMLVAYRQKRDIGVRELAKLIGVSAATLNRVENGEECSADTFVKLLLWMRATS